MNLLANMASLQHKKDTAIRTVEHHALDIALLVSGNNLGLGRLHGLIDYREGFPGLLALVLLHGLHDRVDVHGTGARHVAELICLNGCFIRRLFGLGDYCAVDGRERQFV